MNSSVLPTGKPARAELHKVNRQLPLAWCDTCERKDPWTATAKWTLPEGLHYPLTECIHPS